MGKETDGIGTCHKIDLNSNHPYEHHDSIYVRTCTQTANSQLPKYIVVFPGVSEYVPCFLSSLLKGKQ